MKHPIATTHNGIPVYVDLVWSQAAARISRQPHLLVLVKELVERTSARSAEMHFERDMGRTIGYDQIVETSDTDAIVYAQFQRESIFARFVKNSKPSVTRYLTIKIRRDDEGSYELCNAWTGRLVPTRPGSDDEAETSRPYWTNHAFVLDEQLIQRRTLTKICPYEVATERV
jgi:hypothetical protein